MAIVDIADFKEYQRIQHNHEDILIYDLLDHAEAAAVDFCRREFDEINAPGPVKLAIMLHAGYNYEKRSVPDEKSYQAMMRAFRDLIAPYSDPDKEF